MLVFQRVFFKKKIRRICVFLQDLPQKCCFILFYLTCVTTLSREWPNRNPASRKIYFLPDLNLFTLSHSLYPLLSNLFPLQEWGERKKNLFFCRYSHHYYCNLWQGKFYNTTIVKFVANFLWESSFLRIGSIILK